MGIHSIVEKRNFFKIRKTINILYEKHLVLELDESELQCSDLGLVEQKNRLD